MTDFDGLCRLCLKPSSTKMVNVSHFDELIKQIARLRLVKHPMIPHKLCSTCSGIIIAAGMLRINAVESNRFFLEYLESKQEKPFTEEEVLEWEAELEFEEKQQEKKDDQILAQDITDDIEMTLVGELQDSDDTKDGGFMITEYDINGCETNSGYFIIGGDANADNNVITQAKIAEIENMEPNIQQQNKEKTIPMPPPSKNCRLCLVQCTYLPEENGMQYMKSMVRKIMTMKKFVSSPNASVPDRLCDDCMGKLLIASDIADKSKAAYEFFHPKISAAKAPSFSSTLCFVCLTEFDDENEITIMTTTIESYFHLIASRNSAFKKEMDIKKQICLKCVHDLELTNTIRYKNWKTEKVLELQFGVVKTKCTGQERPMWIWDENSDSDDEETRDFTSCYLNPPLPLVVDCQYCMQQFTSESKLRTHLIDAHVPVSPECLQCGLKLANERGARLHYMSVHMRFVEAICDICGKTYHSANKLNKHRLIHFDDRNVACTMCEAKFKRRDNLKIHMRVHSGFKPFKCSYCSKCYAHHTDLKRHTFSHTGQHPFICKYCKSGFCKKAELKEHEEQHNPFDPNRKLKAKSNNIHDK
ncbi:uncharacterized protein LOC134833999 [Culicoides brevitarsis]|uniref:uncharacterized protein LOC134833999 n=1 Tax=Culicoides brevitarsis TaxID=469753 RepID=UPI00307C69D4